MKRFSLLLLVLFSFLTTTLKAQTVIPDDLNSWIHQQFEKGLDSLGIVGASIVLVHQDSIIHKAGYGVENIDTKAVIDPDTSIFTIASISKTITATAVMQLYEQGEIDLDTDINTYLKSITIRYPFKDAITVRQLLTHTAGFDERNLSTKVRSASELIPLADHLKMRMPLQVRNSNEVFDYSNYGFALLGLIVEEVAKMPFSSYVKENITDPLRMVHSGFDYDKNAQNSLVTSYLQKNGDLHAYGHYFALNYPAGGFHSTASDMGNYIRMYLNKGVLDGTQVLKSETVEKMWGEVYQHFPESRDAWGLGFDQYTWRNKKIMGHGGDILGFATDMRLLPDENLGMYVAFNSSSIPGSVSKKFLQDFWYQLLKKIFPNAVYTENVVPPIAAPLLPLSEYEGTYRFTRYAHNTLDKLAVFIGFAPEVKIVIKNDSLNIETWNLSLYPTGGNTFFLPKNNQYAAFGEGKNEHIQYFYMTGTEGYHKLKFYDTVKFQIVWISVILCVSLFVLLRIIWMFAKRKKYQLLHLDKIQGVIAILLFVFLGVVGYTLATTDPQEFLYGLPQILEFILYVPFIIIGLLIISLFFLVKSYRAHFRWIHIFNTLAFIGFIWWLYNWNLIGFNY